MAKGRRKSNRARTRQRSGKRPPESGPIQPGKKTAGQNTGGVAEKRVNTGPQEPQGEWVAVEHRDADGNPTLPKELIAGTYRRRFDEAPDGTEIRVHVLAGYKPKALMLVERKIYEIHRMPVRGWRRIGQIAAEMEGWREHEGAWFTAMRGVKLEISDPGLPGPHNEKSEHIVSETSFHRKIVKSVAQGGKHSELKLYEGTLDIAETWKSAWQRQAAEVLNMGFKYLLLPLLAALVAGLAVWLIDRSPSPAGPGLETRVTPAGNAEREIIQEPAGTPSGKSMNSGSGKLSEEQSADGRQDSPNGASTDKAHSEGATQDGSAETDRGTPPNPLVKRDVSGNDESGTSPPTNVQEGGEPAKQ